MSFTIKILILYFSLVSIVQADDIPVIDLATFIDGSVTSEAYAYLVDPSGVMTVVEIGRSEQWHKAEPGRVVKSLSQGAIWMHLRIKNTATTDMAIKLEHTESRVNRVELYSRPYSGGMALQQASALGSFDLFGPVTARPYPHHRPVFPITVKADQTTDFFIKFEYLPNVRGAIYTEFRVWKSTAFEQAHIREETLLILFFVIHIVMGVITLTVYGVTRDRVFLFYAFYAFATVGTRSATNGMLGPLIYPAGMSLSELMLPIAIYQMTIFLFSREFLQVKEAAPKWDYALKFVMGCCSISILAALSGYASYVGLMTEAITATYPIVLVISVICWRKGVENALLFAIGWSILLAGGIVSFAARDSGWVEHTPWSYWFAHIGALIEVFLLAGLLVSRIFTMIRAKSELENKYQVHLESYSEELKRTVDKQTIELREAKEKAESEARTDVLTELTNRRHFIESGLQAFDRAWRKSWDVWLVLIDIDHFKHVNDTYGHAAGDVVLRVLAKVLASKMRNVDSVARIGGEEFALLIEGGNQQEALFICERIRRSVEELTIIHDGIRIPITISVGVAKKASSENFDRLMKRSDDALYKAKKGGRNCVVEA